MTKLKAVFNEMRVWQWSKNALVFAPLIFGAKLFELNPLVDTVLVFFAMSFAASTAYVFNDLFDIEDDKKHPVKKKRPLASGALSVRQGKALIATSLVLAIGLSLLVSVQVLALVILYLVFNLLYSKILKHKAILDILIVAFFYIYRVYLGAVATDLHVSGWILLTTFLLALFMITGKRRAELVTAAKSGQNASRKVLGLYNQKFLDAALTITITLFVMFYSLYSVLVQDGLFILTIFPVIYISLRYLYLIFVRNEGEEPEKLIFKDREIFTAGILLCALIVVALYTNNMDIIKL